MHNCLMSRKNSTKGRVQTFHVFWVSSEKILVGWVTKVNARILIQLSSIMGSFSLLFRWLNNYSSIPWIFNTKQNRYYLSSPFFQMVWSHQLASLLIRWDGCDFCSHWGADTMVIYLGNQPISFEYGLRTHTNTIHGTDIFAYIWLICMVNVGKCTIHAWYG